MENIDSETVKTKLYAFWTLNPDDEGGVCEMISESSEERLASLLNVPSIDMEFSHHAARCENCQRKLGRIADAQLPPEWHQRPIVERLAEVKRRMDSSEPKNLLKIQRI